MAQEALLQKLEEAASKARLLGREKSEAIAKMQALEREAVELSNVISLAELKADELLKDGYAPDASMAPVIPSQTEEQKRRFPS